MEAFWVFPWLVWVGVWPMFAESRPVLSLVSVIIVLAVSLLVTRVSIRQKWTLWLMQSVVVGGGFVTMFLVLRFEYGAGYTFFSGQWFTHMGQMLGATFDSPNPVVLALPVMVYLWWRGMQLGRTTSYFSNIYRSFVIGMVALIVLIILWQVSSGAGDEFEGPISSIGLYVIAFFFFGLIALAICHLYLMRRRMPSGDTTLTSGWRSLPVMLGVIGGIVAAGFAAASLVSAEFFTTIKQGGNVILDALGKVVHYILIPFNYVFEGIFYLVQLIINWLRGGVEPEPLEGIEPGVEGMTEVVTKDIPPIVTTILQWLVVAAIVAVVVYILARAIARYRDRLDRDDIEEIHESLWSLSGLREDLRLLFKMMGERFKRKPKPARSVYYDDTTGRLEVREMYRRLLWEGARSGVVRRRHETTFEYEGRLGQHVPDGREELAQITDLYTEVRYGGIRPEEEKVDSANGLWQTLRSLLRGLRGD